MTLISKTEQTVGEARLTVAVNDDDVQAGYNDTALSINAAGGFLSFPTTASLGTFKFFATNQGGNYASTMTNAAFAQAVALTVPDPSAATASFVLNTGTTTMAAGSQINLDAGAVTQATSTTTTVVLNKQSGVITTFTQTLASGSALSFTFTNSKISTSSVILLSLMGGSNSVAGIQLQAVAGSGSATISIANNNVGASALSGTLLIGFLVV